MSPADRRAVLIGVLLFLAVILAVAILGIDLSEPRLPNQ